MSIKKNSQKFNLNFFKKYESTFIVLHYNPTHKGRFSILVAYDVSIVKIGARSYQNIIALINMDDSGAAYTTIYSMGGVEIYPVNNIVIYK